MMSQLSTGLLLAAAWLMVVQATPAAIACVSCDKAAPLLPGV